MNELAKVARVAHNVERLDPFGFYPDAASGMAGLGGQGAAPYPGYAFHTSYVEAGAGVLVVELAFTGLGGEGTLLVQVNRLTAGAQRVARIAAQQRFTLSDLAAQGGSVRLAFEGVGDASYALLGFVEDAADARAASLEAKLVGGAPLVAHAAAVELARDTILRPDADPRLAALHLRGPATLADPVSQPCTAAQFEEPAYRHWLERLHLPAGALHRKFWEFAFVLQALHRYGALRPGARGLGFGVGHEALPALMAAIGADVVATDLPPDHADARAWHDTGQHVAAADALRRPEICADEQFDRHVSFRPVDMTAISADLSGFDFCWSSCAFEHLGSIAAGLRFVEDSVRCLAPGGLAVHTTELNLSSNEDTVDDAGTVLFRRRDMEELALRLIAAGHRVAPLRLDVGDRPVDLHVDVPPFRFDPHLKIAIGRFTTTSFGMIVQRGGF